MSANLSGVAGNGASTWPVVEGFSSTYFQSDASDLVATDTNGTTDIFRQNGPFTTLVSVNAEGTDSGNGPSTMPGQLLSSGGLAFNSEATDLGPTDANGVTDVYMRNTGLTHAISTNRSQRTTGNRASRLMTPRGQQLLGPPLFESEATDLGPSVGGSSQVYVSQVMGADVSLFSVQISQIATSAELFFTVFNHGPEPALGNVAIIPLPPGVTLVPSQSPGCQTVPDVPAVTCSLGGILVNDRLNPSVLFDIDAPAGTLIELQILVGSETFDPFPGNNRSSIVFEHSPPD